MFSGEVFIELLVFGAQKTSAALPQAQDDFYLELVFVGIFFFSLRLMTLMSCIPPAKKRFYE